MAKKQTNKIILINMLSTQIPMFSFFDERFSTIFPRYFGRKYKQKKKLKLNNLKKKWRKKY